MEQRRIVATLECAGNGRKGFGKACDGEIMWGEGAVGTAIWGGVPLSSLFKNSGFVSKSTKVVYFEGIEKSTRKFERYLPIEKALDSLLALRMNGKDLTVDHGYPCRLIVPGWYAMASVKWLSRIRVSNDEHPYSYFNDEKYVYKTINGEKVTPVREIRVKSTITTPAENETVGINTKVLVRGKAWSGAGKIVRVEFKAEDGEWSNASIDGKISHDETCVWTNWSKEWVPTKLGRAVICSRATDEKGFIQPEVPIDNVFQYGFNATTTRTVIVEDSSVINI